MGKMRTKGEQNPLQSKWLLLFDVKCNKKKVLWCEMPNLIIGSGIILEFCVCSLIIRWWWYNCQRHRKETNTSPAMNLQTADFSTCSGAFFIHQKVEWQYFWNMHYKILVEVCWIFHFQSTEIVKLQKNAFKLKNVILQAEQPILGNDQCFSAIFVFPRGHF